MCSNSGACFGAGVDIITACDIRYSTQTATFCVKVCLLALLLTHKKTVAQKPCIALCLCHDADTSASMERHFFTVQDTCRKLTSQLLLTWERCSDCRQLLVKVQHLLLFARLASLRAADNARYILVACLGMANVHTGTTMNCAYLSIRYQTA